MGRSPTVGVWVGLGFALMLATLISFGVKISDLEHRMKALCERVAQNRNDVAFNLQASQWTIHFHETQHHDATPRRLASGPVGSPADRLQAAREACRHGEFEF